MEVNFKDQLLDDYFKEIIAKNKELSMLKANIYSFCFKLWDLHLRGLS